MSIRRHDRTIDNIAHEGLRKNTPDELRELIPNKLY